MSHQPYAARRQALFERLGDGIAIIPTAPEMLRNRDTHHRFRFDSYFWYLSGFPEPEAVIVLIGGAAPKSILFCREKNEEREVWDGYRYGPPAAREAFGFDEAYPIAEFDQRLPDLLADRTSVWHALGLDPAWDQRLVAALNTVRTQVRAGRRAPATLVDLRSALDAMRLVKDAHELEVMHRAAAITSAGHQRAMRVCRPGMAEYELEAEIAYEFRRRGASGHSFSPIVAGGHHACVLHYVENDKLLPEHGLVLIDAGCELEGYAADVTRTFPVSGRFSPAQKAVYEVVLAAQQAGINAIRPGVPFNAYHDATLRALVEGLVDLGALEGSVDGLIESEAYKPYYMHRAGHWLGIDVHDAGEYKSGDDWTRLVPGMTLTVEPGLYIRHGSAAPAHLHGIGIRIEDDVQVTAEGNRVYTDAPKTVAEIEETMRRDRD